MKQLLTFLFLLVAVVGYSQPDLGRGGFLQDRLGNIAYMRSSDLGAGSIAVGELGRFNRPYTTGWDSAFVHIGGSVLSNPNNTSALHFLPGSYTISGSSPWTKLATNTRYYNFFGAPGTFINFTGLWFDQTAMSTGGINFFNAGTTRMSGTTNNYDEVPATIGRFRFYSNILELASRTGLNTSCFNAAFKENSISGDLLRVTSTSVQSLWQPSTYNNYPNVVPIRAGFNVDFRTLEILDDRFFLFAQATRMYDSEININLGTVMNTSSFATGFTPYYFGYDGNSIYRRNVYKINIGNIVTTGSTTPFANARIIPIVGPTVDSCSYSLTVGSMVLPTIDVGYFSFTGKGSTFVIDVDKADLRGAVLNFVGGTYDSCTFIVKGNYESSTSLVSISAGTFNSSCRIILDGRFKVNSANPVINITGGTIPAGVIILRNANLVTNNATSINSTSSVTILSSSSIFQKPLGSNVLINGDYYANGRKYTSTASGQTVSVFTAINTVSAFNLFAASTDPNSSITGSAGDLVIRSNGDLLGRTTTGNTGWSKFLRLSDNLSGSNGQPLALVSGAWAPANNGLLLPVVDNYGITVNNTGTGLSGLLFNSSGTGIAEFIYTVSSGNAVLDFTGKRAGGGLDSWLNYNGNTNTIILGPSGAATVKTGNIQVTPYTTVSATGTLPVTHSIQYLDLASTGTVTIPNTFLDGTNLYLINKSGTTTATVNAGSGQSLSVSITLSPGQIALLHLNTNVWYKLN